MAGHDSTNKRRRIKHGEQVICHVPQRGCAYNAAKHTGGRVVSGIERREVKQPKKSNVVPRRTIEKARVQIAEIKEIYKDSPADTLKKR